MLVWMHAYMPLVPAQVRERNRNLARGMARGMVAPFFRDEHAKERAAAEAAAAAEVHRHGEAAESAEKKVVRWSGIGEHVCEHVCERTCVRACVRARVRAHVRVRVHAVERKRWACVAPGSLRAPEGARESTLRWQARPRGAWGGRRASLLKKSACRAKGRSREATATIRCARSTSTTSASPASTARMRPLDSPPHRAARRRRYLLRGGPFLSRCSLS